MFVDVIDDVTADPTLNDPSADDPSADDPSADDLSADDVTLSQPSDCEPCGSLSSVKVTPKDSKYIAVSVELSMYPWLQLIRSIMGLDSGSV